ncbi:hypothetical protein AWENTII_006271 [Aspergillus wentii]
MNMQAPAATTRLVIINLVSQSQSLHITYRMIEHHQILEDETFDAQHLHPNITGLEQNSYRNGQGIDELPFVAFASVSPTATAPFQSAYMEASLWLGIWLK